MWVPCDLRGGREGLRQLTCDPRGGGRAGGVYCALWIKQGHTEVSGVPGCLHRERGIPLADLQGSTNTLVLFAL